MLNTKMVLEDGTIIYPRYLGSEARKMLKDQMGSRREYMWCGCKANPKIFYRISEDLRIYPEHQGCDHSVNCIRYDTSVSRNVSGFVSNEVDGTITAFLKFNPFNFTIPKIKSIEEEEETDELKASIDLSEESEEKDKKEEEENKKNKDKKEKKEPTLSLGNFIRDLNVDAYSERTHNGGSILTADYFTTMLNARLKVVRVSTMEKPLREYKIQEDGIQFFYMPFLGVEENTYNDNTSSYITLRSYDKKEYKMFIFQNVLRKAMHDYEKRYGTEPNGSNVMAAGFQYMRENKYKTRTFKVVGRLHLFRVSDHGIYSRSIAEERTLNTVLNYIKNQHERKLKFFIPTDDNDIIGVLEGDGYKKSGIFRLLDHENEDEKEDNSNNVYLDFETLENTITINDIKNLLMKMDEQ